MTDPPLRFTFVSARYGAEILGGAEALARHVAERLAARGHDVRVLTTRARSYATWASELPEGTTIEQGVEVRRYAAAPRRTPWDDVLKALSGAMPSSDTLAHAWTRAQGPVSAALIDRLPGEARERDLIVFFQLLSHPTVAGMPRVAAKAALVPLVHAERPICTAVAGRTLTIPRVLLVNTDAEAARILSVARGPLPPIIRTGAGLEQPTPPSPAFVPPTPYPYILVMGRQGKSKPLPAVWRALAGNTRLPPLEIGGMPVPWTDVRLVVAGEGTRMFAGVPQVVHTGWVSTERRWDMLRGAVALINPSVHESLSLVLLEAWSLNRPVVVHQQCDVTAQPVRESEGGIAADFAQPAKAAGAIAAALRSESDRAAMGARGRNHVDRTFCWDRVLGIYERVAREARRDHSATTPAGG